MPLFTSESVTSGHPDKVCDQISDAILDAYLHVDPHARVAVETMATATGLVIAGEVRSTGEVDRPAIARQVLAAIGYTAESGLDPYHYPILDAVTGQSQEIAHGVDDSLELRSHSKDLDPYDVQGAGDQGIMFGYATDETSNFMPLPIEIAHALGHRLEFVRRMQAPARLRPDGKTQVTVAYDGRGVAQRIDTVVVSTQHSEGLTGDELTAFITERVVYPVLDGFRHSLDVTDTRLVINPSGSFLLGGPAADTGLTGRKIIVDTYGGMARHGGGAFSGKDPSKVDRSAAYAMRWVAKNVVAAGLARRCEVQVAYAIGQAAPVGLYVETFGTGTLPPAEIEAAILEVFDLRPLAIIDALDLREPRYAHTATYGHFGDRSYPWERLNRAGALRVATGLASK